MIVGATADTDASILSTASCLHVSRYGTILPMVHPSALLRAQDPDAERRFYGWLLEDLRTAVALARAATASAPA